MRQHESLDTPPNLPIFTGFTPYPTSTRGKSLSDALTIATTTVVSLLTPDSDWSGKVFSSTMSPAKRAHVSGQDLSTSPHKLKKIV